MSITVTPRLGLTRWGADTDPQQRSDFVSSIDALEANATMFLETTAANRPAAGKAGRLHRATDTGVFSWDTGTAWVDILVQPVITAGYLSLVRTV